MNHIGPVLHPIVVQHHRFWSDLTWFAEQVSEEPLVSWPFPSTNSQNLQCSLSVWWGLDSAGSVGPWSLWRILVPCCDLNTEHDDVYRGTILSEQRTDHGGQVLKFSLGQQDCIGKLDKMGVHRVAFIFGRCGVCNVYRVWNWLGNLSKCYEIIERGDGHQFTWKSATRMALNWEVVAPARVWPLCASSSMSSKNVVTFSTLSVPLNIMLHSVIAPSATNEPSWAVSRLAVIAE